MLKRGFALFLGGIVFTAMLFDSCSESKQDNRYVPYVFNTNELDSLVKLKVALLDEVKRTDGSLFEKRYYLGDSVKYILTYNKSQTLLNVSKHEGADEVWTENYYPNGQRLSRFTRETDARTGASYYQGPYQSYYQTGWLKEEGMYKLDKPYWMLPYTESGMSGDTIFYEYQEGDTSNAEPLEIK